MTMKVIWGSQKGHGFPLNALDQIKVRNCEIVSTKCLPPKDGHEPKLIESTKNYTSVLTKFVSGYTNTNGLSNAERTNFA